MTSSVELGLRAGEWVEVLSKEEILKTLDPLARLEEMPFMPEMFQHCGKRHKVGKRAHKTCDPVNGLGGRSLKAAVHLEGLRCDGSSHGGCEAGCLLFWKEAWLRRAGELPAEQRPDRLADGSELVSPCTETLVAKATIDAEQSREAGETVYVCQATKVADATEALRWWNVTQYVEDVRSGNVRVAQLASTLIFHFFHALAESGFGVGTALRGMYDRIQRSRHGVVYPFRRGRVPRGKKTPSVTLGLEAGDLVRMKSFEAILETLDENSRNRGLYFDSEMVPYCNGTYRVLKRLERIIDEKSGRMIRFKTDVLLLDGVVCQARYAKFRKFCPRGYYQYAREVWLERLPTPDVEGTGAMGSSSKRASDAPV